MWGRVQENGVWKLSSSDKGVRAGEIKEVRREGFDVVKELKMMITSQPASGVCKRRVRGNGVPKRTWFQLETQDK